MPSFIASLAARHRQPELMDQPELDSAAHDAALEGLARLNRVSRSATTIWGQVKTRMRQDPARKWRLLDVASGAGDVAVKMAQLAARAGYSLDVEGCDFSDRAVAHANRRSRESNASARFFRRDVLADGLPEGFDFVITSLFLHHLDPDDAVALLKEIGAKARSLGVVSDLRRTKLGYAMAVIAGHGLTTSKIVHTDGPLSVKAAFTIPEAKMLARRAELEGRCSVRPIWPQRFLMMIEGAGP